MTDSKPTPSRSFSKYIVAAIPVLAVFVFFAYLWFVSRVLPSEEHHPDGKIKAVGYVKRFGFTTYLKHGHWVTYHRNEQKASEGFYESGMKTGAWTYWDEDGNKLADGAPE